MANKKDIEQSQLAIIGAGAAGLSATLAAARHGLNTIVFESKSPGGRAGGIPYIESFPGLGRIKGTEFVKSLRKQIDDLAKIELHEFEPVKGIRQKNNSFIVVTDNQEYKVKYVILAMGAEHKHLGTAGEIEFKGKGVSYCAACDGLFFRNKNTVVIGNDTHAVEQALFLDELGSNVTLITPDIALKAEPKLNNDLQATSVNVFYSTDIKEIYGERLVGGVRAVKNATDKGQTEKELDLEAKGVFISMGLVPRTELVKGLNVILTDDGYIQIDDQFQTNIQNLYAIGDLTANCLELVSVCAMGAEVVNIILKQLE